LQPNSDSQGFESDRSPANSQPHGFKATGRQTVQAAGLPGLLPRQTATQSCSPWLEWKRAAPAVIVQWGQAMGQRNMASLKQAGDPEKVGGACMCVWVGGRRGARNAATSGTAPPSTTAASSVGGASGLSAAGPGQLQASYRPAASRRPRRTLPTAVPTASASVVALAWRGCPGPAGGSSSGAVHQHRAAASPIT